MTFVHRAAIIGTGFIGPVHLEALRRIGVEVAAIIGSSPEKSRVACERFGVVGPHRTFEDVIADSTIDVVHITTPNHLHHRQALAVVAADKHVVCEKPLALTTAQCEELLSAARQQNVLAAVAHNIRFYPLCHEAAHRVRSGSIGRPLHVHGGYVQDWLLRDTDFNWRVQDDAGGKLRAVADIGTHWMDLIQFICGQSIVRVCANLQTVHPTRKAPVGDSQTFSGVTDNAPTRPVEITTEDAAAVMFELDGGAMGTFLVSQTTAGRKNCLRFEIAGSENALSFCSERPNELWIGHRENPNESLIRDPALMSEAAAAITNYPGGHNEGFPDTFKQLFANFYAALEAFEANSRRAPSRSDQSSVADSVGGYPTFADGWKEVALCEAILQSHQDRRWVDVPTLAGNNR